MPKTEAKKTTPKAAKAEGTVISNRYADDDRIVVKEKKNPKQPGTAAHAKYQLLLTMSNNGAKKVTAGEYRKKFNAAKFKGDGVGREITHCKNHGFIDLEAAPVKKAVAA